MRSSVEVRRVSALESYDILDTPREAAFDDITRMASLICATPMALISLVEAERQWFKSEIGMGVSQTPIGESICAHAILGNDVLVVPDIAADARFVDNPLVTGHPKLKFYAGALITTPGGISLGTVCVMDTMPRVLGQPQIDALRALARQVMMQLELRKMLRLSEQTSDYRARLLGQVGIELRQSLFIAMLAVQAVMPNASAQHLRRLKLADDSLETIKKGFNRLLTEACKRSTFSHTEFADCRLDSVMSYVSDHFLAAADHKGIRLRVIGTRLRVYSNGEQLEAMVGNLVANAIKYTQAGGAVLVGCRRKAACVEIHVIDTGIGIAEEAVSGLFEAFRQVDTKTNGLGLGLWIVKNTAERLGIVVQVHSLPARGTRFVLRIPHAGPDEVEHESPIQILETHRTEH